MNPLSILTLLAPIFSTLIDRLFPDPEKAAEAKLAMQAELDKAAADQAQANAQVAQSTSNIIVAEAQSQSWLTRNCRPMFMCIFMILIANQYIINPILVAIGLPIVIHDMPPQAWDCVLTFLGVYALGRSGEKIVNSYSQSQLDKAKLFADLKRDIFKNGLSQDQVDAVNNAIDDASK